MRILRATAVLVFCLGALPVASGQGPAQPARPAQPNRMVLSAGDWRRVDQSARRGLEYLAKRQAADGSFPSHHHGQPAVTALGVLAFMQHGHLPGRGPYGDTLEKAVQFILSCQHENGLISLAGPSGPIRPTPVEHNIGVATTYNHAISGLALSELYGVSPDQEPKLKKAIEDALRVTLTMQRWSKQRAVDKGGWRYYHRFNDRDSDLSVVGWHLKFLRSAKNAGFDPPEAAIGAAVEYVLRCYTPAFRTFEYEVSRDDRRTRAMAGAGILALAHTSRHNRPEALAAADWVLGQDFTQYNQQAWVGNHSYNSDRYHYSVFYCTLAMYQIGGEHWQRFFPPVAHTLVANQGGDGAWQSEGAHDGQYGQCYTSSLVLLTLGAPNQLLPIYQR